MRPTSIGVDSAASRTGARASASRARQAILRIARSLLCGAPSGREGSIQAGTTLPRDNVAQGATKCQTWDHPALAVPTLLPAGDRGSRPAPREADMQAREPAV